MRSDKPGGSYTKPIYDFSAKTIKYEVYVNWRLIATVDTAAEAEERLLLGIADFFTTSR